MVRPLDSITSKALELPEDQRITLANRILSSIAPEHESEWDSEIQRRIEAYDNGETKAIPASEVFKKLDETLKKT
jgi:putative addiction module component (TIGR02574 family)